MSIPKHGLPITVFSSDPDVEVGQNALIVENQRASFGQGKEFRTFKELNVSAMQTYVVRVTVPINIILHEFIVTTDKGDMRITTTTGGTEGGNFNETLPVIPKNGMTDRPFPYYVNQVSVEAGGTITGGTVLDIIRLVAPNATSQQQSVGVDPLSKRGIAPGTYHYAFENIGNGSVTGVVRATWEERP